MMNLLCCNNFFLLLLRKFPPPLIALLWAPFLLCYFISLHLSAFDFLFFHFSSLFSKARLSFSNSPSVPCSFVVAACLSPFITHMSPFYDSALFVFDDLLNFLFESYALGPGSSFYILRVTGLLMRFVLPSILLGQAFCEKFIFPNLFS